MTTIYSAWFAWFAWILFSAFSLVAYHFGLKGMSQSFTIFSLLFYTGLVSAFVGAAGSYLASVYSHTLQSPSLWQWICLGMAVLGQVCVTLGFFKVYQTHGPLSLSQPIVISMVSTSLFFIGFLVLKEKVQPSQFLGLLFVVIGLILLAVKFK